MRYHGRMVSLCKAHGKLGSMTFAFDLMHLIKSRPNMIYAVRYAHEQSYKHTYVIYIFQFDLVFCVAASLERMNLCFQFDIYVSGPDTRFSDKGLNHSGRSPKEGV